MTSGIFLIDKPKDKTSFFLVHLLRKLTQIKKIGHAGTLDPIATGVMVMLIGKEYTKQSNEFIKHDKEYIAKAILGMATDSYDTSGKETNRQDPHLKPPSLEEVEAVIEKFIGNIWQIPPMFSAKKQNGKKLYELARQGITVEREARAATVEISILNYNYPYLELHVSCSSGFYIRSLIHDIGISLETYAAMCELKRIRSGPFSIDECIHIDDLDSKEFDYTTHLKTT